MPSFLTAPFSKCFPSTLKRKAKVLEFLRFASERFQKAPFSVNGRANGRNKAALISTLNQRSVDRTKFQLE